MDDAATLAMQMQRIAFDAAQPIRPGDSVKVQRTRAYQALKNAIPQKPLKFWRVIAAWKGEAGCWSGTAALDFQKRDAARKRREETSNERRADAAAALAKARDELARIDPGFYRESIEGLGAALHEIGVDVRPPRGAARPSENHD